MKRLRRSARERRDDGATAVEFALVAPVLILLVFGIMTYGLWFSDSLATRQGVREAARQGVVGTFGSTTSCGLSGASGDANSLKLMCTAQDRIGGITGDPAIKVMAPEGWLRGKPLVVCSQLQVGVGAGIIPLPSDRIIRSQVEMAIENATPAPPFTGGEETAPAGADWSWCG